VHSLQIDLESSVHRPGEQLRGQCSWELEQAVDAIEVRLFWHTSGKGTRDVGIVATQRFAAPGLRGSRAFAFDLPDGPYSFSGKLITLSWTVEIVALPGDEGVSADFVLSPTGTEVQLSAAE
jgi:hypothetical protein